MALLLLLFEGGEGKAKQLENSNPNCQLCYGDFTCTCTPEVCTFGGQREDRVEPPCYR